MPIFVAVSQSVVFQSQRQLVTVNGGARVQVSLIFRDIDIRLTRGTHKQYYVYIVYVVNIHNVRLQTLQVGSGNPQHGIIKVTFIH